MSAKEGCMGGRSDGHMADAAETIGRRIARLRIEQGMTQERLAHRLGVSAQAVSKWENDLNYPDVTSLPVLARLLGISVDELLTDSQTSRGVAAPESAVDSDTVTKEAHTSYETTDGTPYLVTDAVDSATAGATVGTMSDARTESLGTGHWLHITTHKQDNSYGDVDVRVPLRLARPFLKLGTSPAVLAMGQVPEEAREAIASFNAETLRQMIDLGNIGTIVDVHTDDHVVKVTIE